MTCPTCKTDNGITDSVSSGGLVTREKCGDAWHAARLASWPFDPNPPKLIPAENGWVFCDSCEKPQPTSGHECEPGRQPFSWLVEAAAWQERAEFAEDLLNRLAFVHGCEHMGLYDLDPSDLAREPTRSNIARGGWVWALCDAGECPFCDAARKP